MHRFYVITAVYLSLLATLILLPGQRSWQAAAMVLLSMGYLAVLVWGAASVGSQVFVKTVCRGRTGTGEIALTFDDGPHPVNSPMILEVLARNDARATFFLKGKSAAIHEGLVRDMWEAGHGLGNHSFGHSWFFPLLPGRRIRQEVLETNRVISNITGGDVRFFRPPFGVTNPRIFRGLKGTGMQVAGWSIRSWDTTGGGADRVVRRIMRRVGEGDVVLLHENGPDILEILEKLLPDIREKGLKCSTLEEIT